MTANEYEFSATDGGTRAVYRSECARAQDHQKVLHMGVVEVATSAIDRIDALFAG